jgi:hypothetical protein
LENIEKRDALSICSVTPTLCALFGIDPPSRSTPRCIDEVLRGARISGLERIERCLLYLPDAVGTYAYKENRGMFEPLLNQASLQAELLSAYPPVTPVCFASMLTGAPPETHGLRGYVKKVVTCDTLFDALLRAGKRTAIATVTGSSMDVLFAGRRLDRFSGSSDDEVTERTLELIRSGEHDLVVAYHQEYDDLLHANDLRSPACLAALSRHVKSFVRLARACDSDWGRFDRAVVFAPDHGAHLHAGSGTGTHGEDIPEDMEVTHFFGLRPGL